MQAGAEPTRNPFEDVVSVFGVITFYHVPCPLPSARTAFRIEPDRTEATSSRRHGTNVTINLAAPTKHLERTVVHLFARAPVTAKWHVAVARRVCVRRVISMSVRLGKFFRLTQVRCFTASSLYISQLFRQASDIQTHCFW